MRRGSAVEARLGVSVRVFLCFCRSELQAYTPPSTEVARMNRNTSLARLLAHDRPWDMAVIGGGATGVGVAVDAASRGYSVCLVEQSDFGKGTSSRSTKLVHGGGGFLPPGEGSLGVGGVEGGGRPPPQAPPPPLRL